MGFTVQTPSIPDMELCGLRTACHLRMLWKKGEMDQQKNKSVEPMKSRQKMCTASRQHLLLSNFEIL